jgi:hypothetical protein
MQKQLPARVYPATVAYPLVNIEKISLSVNKVKNGFFQKTTH